MPPDEDEELADEMAVELALNRFFAKAESPVSTSPSDAGDGGLCSGSDGGPLDRKLYELEDKLRVLYDRWLTSMRDTHLALLKSAFAGNRQPPEPPEYPELHAPHELRYGASQFFGITRDHPGARRPSKSSSESQRSAEDAAATWRRRRPSTSTRFSNKSSDGATCRRMSMDAREKSKKEMARAVNMMQSEASRASAVALTTRLYVLLRVMVLSRGFQMSVAVAICLSNIFIGVEVDYAASNGGHSPVGFFWLDVTFMALFTIELLVRLLALGREFFTSHDLRWNQFDIFVVMSTVIDVAISSANLKDSSGGILGIIRIVRLARSLRLVRVVRFINSLRHLVHSILHTTKSFLWAMILLTIILYCFGIAFTQAVSDFRYTGVEGEYAEELTIYWGSLPRSMFTLFKSIAGGISWTEVVECLSDVGSFWVALFTFFIAFCALSILNVFTGVFCQNAIESAQNDKELATSELLKNSGAMEKKLSELFREMDIRRTGVITINELEHALCEKKSQAYLHSLGIEVSDAWTLLKLLDVDETNTVDPGEFIRGCMNLKGDAKAIHIATLAYDQRQMVHFLEEFMDSVDKKFAGLMRVSRNKSRGTGSKVTKKVSISE